ncbi:hypothetical protein ETAA8_09510 [Anatilimnocola aggregata]|uniref:Uncharacterized protein n=1 Tax=Anatilimnocola aggregata TaxID=2528021 RepID=A0A517Y6M1_9BACT|nr:hypothetical protein [Anatilimnocola aggregata]QDU25879.1 hypothetical protein ETAA8_09510 [Anatilimnocola aggregata]
MICNIEKCKDAIGDAATIKKLEDLNALGEHFGRYVDRRIGEAARRKAGLSHLPAFDLADNHAVAYAAKEQKFDEFVTQFLAWADKEYEN